MTILLHGFNPSRTSQTAQTKPSRTFGQSPSFSWINIPNPGNTLLSCFVGYSKVLQNYSILFQGLAILTVSSILLRSARNTLNFVPLFSAQNKIHSPLFPLQFCPINPNASSTTLSSSGFSPTNYKPPNHVHRIYLPFAVIVPVTP